MSWDTLMDDPATAAIVLAVVGAVGEGLRRIWKALVAAVVRSLDKVGADADEEAAVAWVREDGGMLNRMAPKAVIRREQRKRRESMHPPEEAP